MGFRYQETTIVIADDCLAEIGLHRQHSSSSKENGGQLFARFFEDGVHVEVATVTRGSSRRTRFGFWPDRKAEQAEITQRFKSGLHYIGDWHTHPEATPSPSCADETKMLEIYRKSTHELPFMLMVIVGRANPPSGLYVGAVHANGIQLLHAE